MVQGSKRIVGGYQKTKNLQSMLSIAKVKSLQLLVSIGYEIR